MDDDRLTVLGPIVKPLPAGRFRVHGSSAEMRWEVMREFRWRTPGLGSYTLRARATDVTGATQPTTVPGNTFGYQFDGIAGHPVITA
jgi:hypothetical protein